MQTRKNDSPTASVIIVNCNGENFISRCIDSLLINKKPFFEIIVVDNGSQDKSLEILRSYSSCNKISIYPQKENIGPAAARNIGARNSTGKYLVFLDNDTEVDSGWLEGAISYLEKNADAAGGQLKIMRMDNSNRFDSIGEKFTSYGFLSEVARGAKDNGQFESVDYIFSGKAAAMIIRRDAFEKAGAFDEVFFIYWEEPDLTWRVWKSGYKLVYLPMGKVYHAYGTERKILNKEYQAWLTYQGCRNQILTIYKNGVGFNRIKMLFSVITAWWFFFLLFLIKLDFYRGKAVLKAFVWLITHPFEIIKMRKCTQKHLGQNFYSDPEWFPLVLKKQNILWYVGKAFSYLFHRPF